MFPGHWTAGVQGPGGKLSPEVAGVRETEACLRYPPHPSEGPPLLICHPEAPGHPSQLPAKLNKAGSREHNVKDMFLLPHSALQVRQRLGTTETSQPSSQLLIICLSFTRQPMSPQAAPTPSLLGSQDVCTSVCMSPSL